MVKQYKLTDRGFAIVERMLSAGPGSAAVGDGTPFYYAPDQELLATMTDYPSKSVTLHENQTKFGRKVARVLEDFAKDPSLVAA